MPYAISLLIDAGAAANIKRHWINLADAGLSRSMIELGYPPHITLCVYDSLDVDNAISRLASALKGVRAIDFDLASLDVFDGGVLYAVPKDTAQLRVLHRVICDALDVACQPQYRPEQWKPHCTLATGLDEDQLEQARALIASNWKDIAGRFEITEIVRFHPVQRLWHRALDQLWGI